MKNVKLTEGVKNKLTSGTMVSDVVKGAVEADKKGDSTFSTKGVSFILKKVRNILVVF